MLVTEKEFRHTLPIVGTDEPAIETLIRMCKDAAKTSTHSYMWFLGGAAFLICYGQSTAEVEAWIHGVSHNG